MVTFNRNNPPPPPRTPSNRPVPGGRGDNQERLDRIRDKERDALFDLEFIELARAVYVTNDERAAVKKRINTKLGSTLVEEKSYADYKRK